MLQPQATVDFNLETSNNIDDNIDNTISSLPEESFGRVLVIKKDGAIGPFISITSSLTFGRDENCDVHIKLPTVSRTHAKIGVNENGEVIILHSFVYFWSLVKRFLFFFSSAFSYRFQ